ncbi:MAG TPA: glycosyltransferase [Epsilonproteobacteria bacterium]|nr:glycosyltransferase [Campylobacterota bacterium]
MNIAIFNTYEQTGGAAKAAYRLRTGLTNMNCTVDYFVRSRAKKTDKSVIQMGAFNRSLLHMDKLIQYHYITRNRTAVSNTLFSATYAGVNTGINDRLMQADIINFHWVEKFLSLESIRQIINLGKPIVWTLHDEKPFTGGCHYTAGCEQYKKECFECIQLERDPHRLAQVTLKSKLDLLGNADLTIVSPSNWLAQRAKQSSVFRNRRIEVIANGVDTGLFSPQDKKSCKEELGIDPSTIVLQFGAQDNREIRKGFKFLADAIKQCFQNGDFRRFCREGKIAVLCVGEPTDELDKLEINTIYTGYVDSDLEMVKLYSATDIFILPSLEDNLPNTMLESLACKTPVIAFDSGGIAEVVNHSNGRLIRKEDTKGMAEAILELVFDEQKRVSCAENGRALIEKKYTLGLQAKKYMALFDSVKSDSTSKCTTVENNYMDNFDAIVGYALRTEAKNNNNLFQMELSEKNLKNIPREEELLESLESLCSIKTSRYPFRKMKAYKTMISVYHRTKVQ